MTGVPRSVVTVGAGQAAVAAVRLLRRRGFDGRVSVLSDEAHLPYQHPPLSKEFLRGEAGPDELVLIDEAWARDHDVDVRLSCPAASVGPRAVELAGGGRVEADAVLIATGVRARRLPGVSGDRVLHLRTLDDARELRAALDGIGHLGIIGGGLIGSEVASAARERGIAVTVFEAGALPMLDRLGRRMAGIYADLHREFGVDLRCGQEIAEVADTADGAVVRTAAGTLECDLVVVAVGSVPNDEIARRSGLPVDPVRGGIVVDDACRTAMAGVFAAGDVAARAAGDGFVRCEHVDNATTQGSAVARTLLGTITTVDEVPWFWSDQYDLNLQFVGPPPAPETDPVVRGSVAERDFTAFYLVDGCVRAAFALDRGGDVPAAKQLIGLGRPVPVESLADDEHDLFDLLDSITT